MSDGIKIEVRATVDKWQAAEDEILKRLGLVVAKTASDIEANAKINAPVDTGFLKSSIQAKPGEDDLHATVDVGAEYGIYVEFGTVRMAAKPYLIPAVDLVRPAFTQAIEQTLRDIK